MKARLGRLRARLGLYRMCPCAGERAAIKIRFNLAEAGEPGPNSAGARNGSSATTVYPAPLLKRPQGAAFKGNKPRIQARLCLRGQSQQRGQSQCLDTDITRPGGPTRCG